MKELLDKLSSYNLFNYLFPGILFVTIAKETTSLDLLQENIITGVFLYYFIGLVISRVGSLLIEPLLKNLSFVKFSDYSDYIKASKKDEKIDLLSEVNNMYRTLISMFVLLLCIPVFEPIQSNYPEATPFIITVTLLALFLWSYKKQTNYITKRIDANKD